MFEDRVADEEHLYRRVRNSLELFKEINGKPRFSSSVFNDPGQKPSVDRATLRNSPSESKHDISDGILYLTAAEVRAIATIKNEGAGPEEPCYYGVDVLPRPIPSDNSQGLPENLAHAQIEATPDFKTSSRFKKLKEALAQVVNQRGWLVEPSNG